MRGFITYTSIMLRFEHVKKPLLSRKKFIVRQVRYVGIALFLLVISLFIGVAGYHWLANLGWVDSILNASMILGGMGPVDVLTSNAAKLFASAYAIYSGVAFIGSAGLIFAPILHRFLHMFHISEQE